MNIKTLASVLVCSSLAVTTLAASIEPYTGSRIFWDTATRKTVFNNGGYARIIELHDGRLMAVTENNGIDIAFSNDRGETWQSPTKLVANPTGVSETVPDLLQLSDGTIIVAYNPRPTTPYSADRKFGIKLRRSVDNGQTWSQEVNVYEGGWDWGTGCWEPTLLELPSGELQLYFADESPFVANNDQQISMCRSTDGGQTWTAPVRTAYRQGARDGMPAAVLLADGKTIAMAFEDNGWAGVGDFIPTIGISPLTTNWHDYWVAGDSPNRWKACDYSYVPAEAKGGAPYLRVLPNGETILSHQSTYGDGENQMYVYVGDAQARGFKAMSAPFSIGAAESAMWNSLAVIDSGTVVAVSAIGGRVEMIKGRAVNTLYAAAGSPHVDGVQRTGEGYYRANATQLILGRELGTRFTGDFAFDSDSLYFTSRVSDADQVAQAGSYGDGVTLLLDTRSASLNTPGEGIYRFFFRANGTMQVMRGTASSTKWQTLAATDTLSVNYKLTRTARYYVVEAAIPWTAMGFTQAPQDTDMRANVMLHNRASTGTTPVYEMLPDSRRDESWSWMKLHVGTLPVTNGLTTIHAPSQEGLRVNVEGNTVMAARTDIRQLRLYTPLGKLLGQAATNRIACTGYEGIAIVHAVLANGTALSSKVCL